MAAIRGYAAEDATIIFGTVYDESLADAIRVTVVATGLIGGNKSQSGQVDVVWHNQATGTYGQMPKMVALNVFKPTRPITTATMHMVESGYAPSIPRMGQTSLESDVAETEASIPSVFRQFPNSIAPTGIGASSSPQAKTMLEKGTEIYDIPAFLRKQAD
jgi:cell division protein FtsZ